MNEFLSILTHGRRLQGAVKSLTIEELEEVKNKLDNIITKRKEKLLAEQQKAEEKRQKVTEIKKQMDALGLSYNDLVSQENQLTQDQKPKEKSVKRPVKYVLTDNQGNEYKWTGIGRMPLVFKNAIESGHDLSEFSVN